MAVTIVAAYLKTTYIDDFQKIVVQEIKQSLKSRYTCILYRRKIKLYVIINHLIQIRVPAEVFHVFVYEGVELKLHVHAQRVHLLTGHGHVLPQRLSNDIIMSFFSQKAARESEKQHKNLKTIKKKMKIANNHCDYCTVYFEEEAEKIVTMSNRVCRL